MTQPTATRPKLIGHRGAPLRAPANTLASFAAAAEAGCEVVELDVLPAGQDGQGPLYIAHDYRELRSRKPLRLEQALRYLSGPRFEGVGLDLDLKLPGYTARVVGSLTRHGLGPRTLITSRFLSELELVARLDPTLTRGWAVPRLHLDYRFRPFGEVGALAAGRYHLPRRAAAVVGTGRAQVLIVHRLLVTPALVEAVHGAGGLVYVWTVRRRQELARLADLRVDGLIVDDPSLFQVVLGGCARQAA